MGTNRQRGLKMDTRLRKNLIEKFTFTLISFRLQYGS
jgi:hypothetical protein